MGEGRVQPSWRWCFELETDLPSSAPRFGHPSVPHNYKGLKGPKNRLCRRIELQESNVTEGLKAPENWLRQRIELRDGSIKHHAECWVDYSKDPLQQKKKIWLLSQPSSNIDPSEVWSNDLATFEKCSNNLENTSEITCAEDLDVLIAKWSVDDTVRCHN